MRKFFHLAVLIVALWTIDLLAYGGYYSSTVLEQASYQGQMVQYNIQDWFKRIGI
jgi:hypothetical protein